MKEAMIFTQEVNAKTAINLKTALIGMYGSSGNAKSACVLAVFDSIDDSMKSIVCVNAIFLHV